VHTGTSLIEKIYDTQSLQCHMVINDNDLGIGSDLVNGKVIFFNITNTNIIKIFDTGRGSEGMSISNSKELWVTNRAEDTISILSIPNQNILTKIQSKNFPIRIKFYKDKVLVSNAYSSDLGIFDEKSRREINKIKLYNNSVPVGILVLKKYSFIASTTLNKIIIIDIDENKILGDITGFLEPDAMGYSQF